MIIYKIENTYSAHIIKRPSKICKTPYVADIIIETKDKTKYLAHTAALGCCGMVDKDKSVIVSDSVNKTNKCKYKILLAKVNEKNNINVIGVDPKIAEDLVEICLKNNLLSTLVGARFIREKTIMNSRFDFVGFDKNGILFIMEVKNVPLADYVNCYKKDKKDRKHMNFDDKDVNSKIAYFPDGYRKNQGDTVSPRPLKHITELTKIKMMNKNKVRTIMCYVIQREDASSFQPVNVDPIYKEEFNKAVINGVEIITLQIGWSIDGCAKFIRDDLPINM